MSEGVVSEGVMSEEGVVLFPFSEGTLTSRHATFSDKNCCMLLKIDCCRCQHKITNTQLVQVYF